MYKLIGVLFIVAGCGGWGSVKVQQEKDRVRHLRTWFHMLGQMRSEISYGRHTLPEICLLLAELNDECYKFLALLRRKSRNFELMENQLLDTIRAGKRRNPRYISLGND